MLLRETARRPGTGDDPVRRIYVAGHWPARYRLRTEVARLRSAGNDVRATWMDQETDDGDPAGEATRDLAEIQRAEVIIVDTLSEDCTGGREFEAGFAHAIGRVVYIVGPARNVFHRLARERWGTWDEAFRSGRFGDPVPRR